MVDLKKYDKEFDDETLQRARWYCGGDPRERREVEDQAFAEYGPDEWPLDEFLNMLDGAVASIPVELRPNAKIEIGEYGRFSVTYTRPQTDEELERRILRALEYVRSEQRKERSEYDRLKQKFGT